MEKDQPAAPAQSPDTNPASAAAGAAAPTAEELISAAEERGYRRGLHEAGRQAVLASRSIWSAPHMEPEEFTVQPEEDILLKCMRPRVWD